MKLFISFSRSLGDCEMEETMRPVRERNMVTSSPIRPGTTCNLW